MKILDSNRYGKTSPKRILELEKRFKISIPHQFRAHLLKHNGGSPFPANFNTKDSTTDVHEGFYGVHDGPEYLQLDNILDNFLGRIPPFLMPIASDSFGNQICIGISKKQNGKIYFWDHEREGKDNAIEQVASGFKIFLSKLYEWEDPNQSDIDKIVEKGSLTELVTALDNGYGLETKDEMNRTLIERASIHARDDMIKYLWKRGAKLRKALSIAKKNTQFFEEHKATVTLLKRLYKV